MPTKSPMPWFKHVEIQPPPSMRGYAEGATDGHQWKAASATSEWYGGLEKLRRLEREAMVWTPCLRHAHARTCILLLIVALVNSLKVGILRERVLPRFVEVIRPTTTVEAVQTLCK